jgi:uncharacterized alkaline shock family protein YloU
METLQPYLQFFADNPYLTFGVVAVGLVLVLILVIKMASRKPKMIMAFSDVSGSVYVSVNAVTDLVRATCEHIDGISKPRVRLREKRGVTHIDLHLRLESGSRIREIRDALREHLKHTLQYNLGIENLGNITVVISEYKAGPLDAISVQQDRQAAIDSRDPEPAVETDTENEEEAEAEKKPAPLSAADLLAEKEADPELDSSKEERK